MAVRRPDGVGPTNGAQEELKPGEFRDEGGAEPPALARAATPGNAINSIVRPGERFPSGLGALEGKSPTDKITLCNLSFRVLKTTKTAGPQDYGKRGVVAIKIQPFQTFETTVEHARSLLLSQENAPPNRRPIPIVVVIGNYSGNCGGKRKFQAHDREFSACPFHDCTHADHNRHPWSVFQAQHFLRMLGTPGAIDRFTTSHDLRVHVVELSIYERRAREDAHRRQQQAAAAGSATVRQDAVW